MKGYPLLTPEQKREIISRIKEKGERVADLAKEYGVQPRTIYGYLSRSGQHSGALLELSRLKREKESLLKIIGELIADQKLGKNQKSLWQLTRWLCLKAKRNWLKNWEFPDRAFITSLNCLKRT